MNEQAFAAEAAARADRLRIARELLAETERLNRASQDPPAGGGSSDASGADPPAGRDA